MFGSQHSSSEPCPMSLFNNVGEPSMMIKSPLELKCKWALPKYLQFAYACRIGTFFFIPFFTISGYGPYEFSILGGVPENVFTIALIKKEKITDFGLVYGIFKEFIFCFIFLATKKGYTKM